MDTGGEAWLSEQRMTCAGLRQFSARRIGPDSDIYAAAVELVINAFDGYLVDLGWPWVRQSDELGLFWLDPEPMCRFDGEGGALRLLPIVEALLGGRRVPQLVQLMARLDNPTIDLVLAVFLRASRWDRDGALYAFGGDPWAIAGQLLARRSQRDADTSPASEPASTTARWAS